MSGQGISAPPPSENLPTFDSSVFIVNNAPITATTGLQYFLGYPDAQGTENLQTINVGGVATFYNNIVMSGLGDSITFPDGSVQTVAYTGGGGSGVALLAGGTIAVPQVFTGVNVMNDLSIGNTTNSTTIGLSCNVGGEQLEVAGYLSVGNYTNAYLTQIGSDITTEGQLDIEGSLLIGNNQVASGNYNSVLLNSDVSNNNQLNINGPVSIGNTTNAYNVLLQSDATNLHQLDIKGGTLGLGNTTDTNLVVLSSNSGSTTGLDVFGDLFIFNPSATKVIQLTANTTQNHQLDINGQLTIGNTPQNGNKILLNCDTTNNNQLNINGSCFITNGTNGTSLTQNSTNLSIISNASGGGIQVGDPTNKSIITTNANGLIFNKGLVISNSSNTNGIYLSSDVGVPNQLDVNGNVLTSQLLKSNLATAPTTTNLQIGEYTFYSVGGLPYLATNPTGTSVISTKLTGVLATYTSNAFNPLSSPYVWNFTGISNSLGNQVNWMLFPNTASATTGASTIYTSATSPPWIVPSGLTNYLFGFGTAIQIPYLYNNGTSTTSQPTYYPTATTALGGFTINAVADLNVPTSSFQVNLTSVANTQWTAGTTLTLVIFGTN